MKKEPCDQAHRRQHNKIGLEELQISIILIRVNIQFLNQRMKGCYMVQMKTNPNSYRDISDYQPNVQPNNGYHVMTSVTVVGT